MMTENTTPTPPPESAPVPVRRRRGKTSPWPLLALVVAGLLAILWFDQRRQLGELREQLDAVREAARQAEESRAAEQEKLLARLGATEGRVDEFAEQADAVQAIQHELARSREEATLLEIEQAINLASQQLQIAGNLPAARLALQAAEVRLVRLERPQFVPLRKAVARDLERLNALTPVDLAGISLRLEQGLAAIDRLPAISYGRPLEKAEKVDEPESTLPFWRHALAEAWQEVKGLVRIQRFDRSEPILLAPGQDVFLRGNLKLRLLNARLALFARDQASFRQEVGAVQNDLTRYFVAGDKGVQDLQASLKTLATTEIGGELPALTESLNALRTLRTGKEKR